MSTICNWEYTGEYERDKYGISEARYKSDCGYTINWTRHNKIGKLFKQYSEESVPVGQPFQTKCPYCGKELNLVNPYDDGETWRKED